MYGISNILNHSVGLEFERSLRMRAVLDRPKSFKKVIGVPIPNVWQQVRVPQVYGDDH